MDALTLFNQIKDNEEILLSRKGYSRTINTEKVVVFRNTIRKQSLYGDIIEWLRDNYPEYRSLWNDVARLLIGDYVIQNSIL